MSAPWRRKIWAHLLNLQTKSKNSLVKAVRLAWLGMRHSGKSEKIQKHNVMNLYEFELAILIAINHTSLLLQYWAYTKEQQGSLKLVCYAASYSTPSIKPTRLELPASYGPMSPMTLGLPFCLKECHLKKCFWPTSLQKVLVHLGA